MINAENLPVPPVLGGAIEQTLFETALSIHNPEMTVISPWADTLKNAGANKQIFHHVDILAHKHQFQKIFSTWKPIGMKNSDHEMLFYYLDGVTDLISWINPDIIQIHNRPSFIPYILKQFPNKPIILYMHNELKQADKNLKAVISKLHRLIFVSQYRAHEFIKYYPECAHKMTVIYNSIDTDMWHPQKRYQEKTKKIRQTYNLSEGKTILFLGRTVQGKGLHLLLDAMQIVLCHIPDAKLIIAGSPFFKLKSTDPFLTRLKKQAARMGNAVIFTGYVENHQTPYFYASADITVVPSIWSEGLPKAILESMATGTPVLGSRRGGIPEVIDDGINGRLIDNPKQVHKLADIILEMLQNKTNRSNMAKAARCKILEHFSTPVRLSHLKAFYKTLDNEKNI